MQTESVVRQKWRLLKATMNERARRLWAGAEAGAIGYGGVAAVARATGMAISTCARAGMRLGPVRGSKTSFRSGVPMASGRLSSRVLRCVGVAVTGATTLRMARAMRDTTGKSMLEVVKGLGRQQRKALAEEAIRFENPGISNSLAPKETRRPTWMQALSDGPCAVPTRR